jgi:hypothetical protein
LDPLLLLIRSIQELAANMTGVKLKPGWLRRQVDIAAAMCASMPNWMTGSGAQAMTDAQAMRDALIRAKCTSSDGTCVHASMLNVLTALAGVVPSFDNDRDLAKQITAAVLAVIKSGGDNLAIYKALAAALPSFEAKTSAELADEIAVFLDWNELPVSSFSKRIADADALLKRAFAALRAAPSFDRTAVDPAAVWDDYCAEVPNVKDRSPQGAVAFALARGRS